MDGTAYSMINFMSDWTFDKKLENTGTGNNIGVDLTIERFLKNGLYLMTTPPSTTQNTPAVMALHAEPDMTGAM